MPENPNQTGGEDMYADASIPNGQAEAPEAAETEAESESEDADSATALLPKSICPGLNPGDEIVVKVVRAHDDQYEVSYSSEPEEESAESAAPAEEMSEPPGGDMASMMED